ncbi:MAG: ricin-type beta-trefoil lectin domain protein [Streptosporangiaceae bacterium]
MSGSARFTWTVTHTRDHRPAQPARLAMGNECLTDEGNSSAARTPANLQICDSSQAQRWTRAADGRLRIRSMCLRRHYRAGWPHRRHCAAMAPAWPASAGKCSRQRRLPVSHAQDRGMSARPPAKGA